MWHRCENQHHLWVPTKTTYTKHIDFPTIRYRRGIWRRDLYSSNKSRQNGTEFISVFTVYFGHSNFIVFVRVEPHVLASSSFLSSLFSPLVFSILLFSMKVEHSSADTLKLNGIQFLWTCTHTFKILLRNFSKQRQFPSALQPRNCGARLHIFFPNTLQ